MSVSVDIPTAGQFPVMVHGVGSQLETMAADVGVDCGDVHVVSTLDFEGTVERTLSAIAAAQGGKEPPPFTTERIGGSVAGKTLPHARDYRDATVVLNGNLIDWTTPDGGAFGLILAAHELAHVVFGRTRFASGIFEGEPDPPFQTGTEFARYIARTVVDEFRADWLSSVIVGSLISLSTPGGGVRPMTIYDYFGPQYVDRLGEVLAESVHPGWPDTVMSYRLGDFDLDQLQRQIVPSTEGVLTLLAHAEAHTHAGGVEDPLNTFADHRGAELYLRPVWLGLAATFENSPPLPTSPQDVRALEERIARDGTAAILAMWETLGLTVEEKGNREWALWVSDPER